MTNVFIVPTSTPLAREHLEDTVMRPVEIRRLKGLSEKSLKAARSASGGLRVWGTKAGKRESNVGKWQAMEPGDWVLFYVKGHFTVYGRLLAKERSVAVAKGLWGSDEEGATWELVYLIDELRQLDAPRSLVMPALGYDKPNHYPLGFMRVARDFGSEPGRIARLLAGLAEEGGELRRAVTAAQDGDDVTVAIAADRLLEGVSGKRLEEIVRGYTGSAPPKTVESLVKRFKRDRRLAANLKALYEGRCQCCGFTFLKSDGEPYSEAAHLRRISLGEADLDIKDNILVLCPNHHKMLDLGPIEIEYDAETDRLLLHEDGRSEEIENKHIGPGRPKGGKKGSKASSAKRK